MICSIDPELVELAARESGYLQVALLWRPHSDLSTVSVNDVATGESFELVVKNESALDVYYHPYAYAALRGVEYTLAA